MKFFVFVILVLGVPFSSFAETGEVLSAIKERGYLKCGVSTALQGFSIQDEQDKWQGFDVEFCRALSVAIFNDPEKVEYSGWLSSGRFKALKDNKIDVLYRNSTMTARRDITLGISFAGVNYYDGQGFLVSTSRNTNSAYKLQGATFCMESGTSSLRNFTDFLSVNNLTDQVNVKIFDAPEERIDSMNGGECDATSADQSALYSLRLSLEKPDEFLILPEIISKEPLGPAVRRGDDQWFTIVRWTLMAMIEAEFLGVNSQNIDTLQQAENNTGSVSRLLGLTENLGPELGLSQDWAYNMIRQIGNYSEVFERTIGSQSELNIARGINAQWNEGGILYSSPF